MLMKPSALGAAYQAAYLSKGFKVKQFNVKDFNLFPIQVDFSRDVESEDNPAVRTTKNMQRMLFGRGNLFPQKKILTFSKHTHDFDFYVNYGDLTGILTPHEVAIIGPLNISKISVTGVREVLAKHPTADEPEGSTGGKKVTAKGIKAHFKLNESGIIELDRIEANFEETTEEEASGINENMISDTIAKLGSTIGKLFGSKTEAEDLNVAVDESQTLDAGGATAGNDSTDSTSNHFNATSSESIASPNTSTTGNVSSANASASATAGVKAKETRTRSIKEKVSFAASFLDLASDEENEVALSRKKLQSLLTRDQEKERRDSLRNALESGITETRMKMYEPEYESASDQKEKEKISQELGSLSDWLDEHSDTASAEELKFKVDSLKSLMHDVQDRVYEHKNRPEQVQALRNMMNISNLFLTGMRNASEHGAEVFTSVEITTLETILSDTVTWLDEAVLLQGNTSNSITPVLTLKQLAEKSAALDREMKYLVNKMRFAPPPKPVTTTTTPAPKKKKKRTSKKEKEGADADAEAVVEEDEEDDDTAAAAAAVGGSGEDDQPEGAEQQHSEIENDSKEESGESSEIHVDPTPAASNASGSQGSDTHTEL